MRTRNRRGISLFEVSVSSLIFAGILLLVGELVSLNVLASVKLNSKAEGLTAARFATESIAADIRSAIGYGDLYASNQGTSLRNEFPCSTNPFITDSKAWAPNWPPSIPVAWNYTQKLSADTLIIQRPAIFIDKRNDPRSASNYSPGFSANRLNGIPTKFAVGSSQLENLETVIYKLFPDTQRPGEYKLYKAVLSGNDESTAGQTDFNSHNMVTEPVLIVRGIVGPLDPANLNGTPNIFRYMKWSRTQNAKVEFAASPFVDPKEVSAIYGVSVDLEIRRPDAGSGSTTDPKFVTRIGIHTEATNRVRRAIFYE